MADHENVIHGLSSGSEPTMVTVGIWQAQMDSLNALIHWLNGFEAAHGTRVPGHFDLLMHYRTVAAAVRQVHLAERKEPPVPT